MTRSLAPVLALLLAAPIACDGASGRGAVQIFVVAEDSIPDGLEPGEGSENVRDGWRVTYDRFLVTVGAFEASRSDGDGVLRAPDVVVLDLVHAPSTGYVVHTWSDVLASRWDRFGFAMPNATSSARPLAPTTTADRDLLAGHGWATYVEGAAEKDGRRITFAWGLPSGTRFADCATPDGTSGFAVPTGGTVQIKPTIHGDHFFFTNVTEGVEITERLAGWIATCDADANGDLTTAELALCEAAVALPQRPTGPYDLTGLRDEDGDGRLSVYDFVATQARTLGDFQGDGECPTRTRLP